MLRTRYSSSQIQLASIASRTRAPSLPRSRANTASAATMPDFIAVWLPLIFGTLRNPALSPISAPPGKSSRGIDWNPPSLSARAP